MTVLVVIARDAHGTVTVVGVYQDIEMARRAAEDRAPWAYIVPSHLLTSRHDALREREDAS